MLKNINFHFLGVPLDFFFSGIRFTIAVITAEMLCVVAQQIMVRKKFESLNDKGGNCSVVSLTSNFYGQKHLTPLNNGHNGQTRY